MNTVCWYIQKQIYMIGMILLFNTLTAQLALYKTQFLYYVQRSTMNDLRNLHRHLNSSLRQAWMTLLHPIWPTVRQNLPLIYHRQSSYHT